MSNLGVFQIQKKNCSPKKRTLTFVMKTFIKNGQIADEISKNCEI